WLASVHGWPVVQRSRLYANVVVEVSAIAIDVESTIGPPGLCGLPVEDMLARARSGTLAGGPALLPELHDHALVLAVNVFKDKLIRAAPWAVADVARIVRTDAFSAPRLAELAGRSGSRTLLWIVADWMAKAHADEVWARVRAACSPVPRPAYARLYRWL